MDRLGEIVKAAVDASTVADADQLQDLIRQEAGAEYRRPLFDTVDNYGALSGGPGLWDHKALEPVTNMQDAVVEREALRRFGAYDLVPYHTPLDAARALFSSTDIADLAARIRVSIRESDSPVREKKLITIVYRDTGVGLSPNAIPNTIFGLASTKKDIGWQQGAFGIGGKTTYRNANRVIVVSRRAPELLAGAEDRIAVAVLQWHFSGKTQTGSYLVTAPWNARGDDPPVFSIPASSFPDFDAGTQLSLISFGVEHIWVGTRLGDDRSFDTLLNTRLFQPVLPVRFHHFEQRESPANLRGLRKRLDDNPGKPPRPSGTETLPFSASGKTYHLPISFWSFGGPSGAAERRRFVAREHVVCFTSNGQVHHHLSQADFQQRIPTLKKLADRIFIVIETDELPIELRSTLFSSDRSAFMRTADALRLEEQVNAFIREWGTLRDLNGELIRESLSKAQDGRSTLSLARELGKAFKGIGFGSSTSNVRGTTATGGTIDRQPIDLLNDPSYIDGPSVVRALIGDVKFIQYAIDARDGFIPERARLAVSIGDDCGLSPKEITVGQLIRGRIRVAISIPEYAPAGECVLTVSVRDWLLSSGGAGPELRFETTLEVRAETDKPPATLDESRKTKSTQESASGGDLIPVIWNNCEGEPSWTAATIGSVDLMSGEAIATARPEYAELKALGKQEIYALQLNRDFSSFKRYIAATARDTTDKTTDRRRDRYAVAVGTGLMTFEIEFKKLAKAGMPVSNEVVSLAHRSIASAVLADMRAYDQLAEEAGVRAT